MVTVGVGATRVVRSRGDNESLCHALREVWDLVGQVDKADDRVIPRIELLDRTRRTADGWRVRSANIDCPFRRRSTRLERSFEVGECLALFETNDLRVVNVRPSLTTRASSAQTESCRAW
jgi:hypothetical protein